MLRHTSSFSSRAKSRWTIAVCVAVIGYVGSALSVATAHADTVAYLVNVTMRPGYNFSSPDSALQYGHALCGRLVEGQSFSQMISAIKTDFGMGDEYQALYLLTQAANELCPAQIWDLRRSAADGPS